jgi:uncharacterized protein YjeT (DUF2065 family)
VSFSDLFVALALVLLLEGIIAFVNPRGLKHVLTRILDYTEGELRFAGLVMMLVGLAIILFLAR